MRKGSFLNMGGIETLVLHQYEGYEDGRFHLESDEGSYFRIGTGRRDWWQIELHISLNQSGSWSSPFNTGSESSSHALRSSECNCPYAGCFLEEPATE